jgi:hypothetical protein
MADTERSPLSRDAFASLIETNLPDNSAGQITPADVRIVFDGLADSAVWHDEAASGASAYDIAVTNGFEGDVSAWLESLTGPAGLAGPAGEPGPAGPVGPVGPQGVDGVDGRAFTGVIPTKETKIAIGPDHDGAIFATLADDPTSLVLPSDSDTNLRIGTAVHALQSGAGVARFVGATGVTLLIPDLFVPETRFRLGALSAVKVGPDAWRVSGDAALTPTAIIMPNGGALSGVIASEEASILLRGDHSGTIIETTSASPITVIAPLDEAISVGAVIRVAQAGDGDVSFVAGAGARLLHCASKAPHASGRDAVVTLCKTSPTTWRMIGDLALLKSFA